MVFAALALLPVLRDLTGFPAFYLVLLASLWFWAAQATSWNILSGYSGYFSFGQGAFVGVGAYAAAVLVGRYGGSYFLSLPIAGVLGLLLGLAIGALAFRLRSLRGEIFALLTLAVPFVLESLARITPAIDGGQGIVIPVPDYPEVLGEFQDLLYLLSLGVAFVAIAVAYAMQYSRFGWALFAVRDAEDVAEGLGVPTFRHKMIAIGLTGLIAGVSGSVFALQIGFVSVEPVFGLSVPLFAIVMSVLGGRNHWLGPTLGAAVLVTIQDRLSASGLEAWSLIILGTVLAALVVLAPDGLYARLRRRPLPVAVAFVVPLAVLAVLRVWGGPLEWLATSMTLGAVAAFIPWRGRGAETIRSTPSETTSVGDLTPTSAEEVVAPPPGASTAETAAPPEERRVVIDCREVAKSFGGVHALRGVTLQVREGEILGLVGPNGSGKTTLVSLMAGFLRPTSGDIRIDGSSILGVPPHRIAHLGVARTYQIPRPFESMTVRDNVAVAVMFGRTPHSLTDARRAAQAHLDLVGLTRLADAYPAEINLHERQLLEMARALATRPKVLLLDEALAGLSPVEIDAAVAVVRRIHESGVAIVIVEHLLRVVNQLADRVVVLEQGRTLAEGAPAVVMRDPEVVRAYLGSHANA